MAQLGLAYLGPAWLGSRPDSGWAKHSTNNYAVKPLTGRSPALCLSFSALELIASVASLVASLVHRYNIYPMWALNDYFVANDYFLSPITISFQMSHIMHFRSSRSPSLAAPVP